jgi:uncharacterized RDD family membrane protein YckC
MSSNPPGQDPQPEPSTESSRPEADAETARVSLDTGNGSGSPFDDATPPPQTPGLVSAEPVGWSGAEQDGPADPTRVTPQATWTPPAAPHRLPGTEGVVISGVFTRLVAYAIDIALLTSLNLAVQAALGLYAEQRNEVVALVVGAVLIAVDLLYFVLLWTSPLHATLGMRLMRLRILGAVTADTLSLNDALLRWLALTGAISILAIVPSVAPTVGLLSVIWLLVLLVTTATHPLRQGLHDRWARSVIVQPAPGGSGLAVVGCLVLIGLFVFVLPLALLALSGDQIRDILEEIGRSV